MGFFFWDPQKVKLNTKSAIVKVDIEQRLVFGWFSIIKENGQVVEDLQGDLIEEAELEKTAYDFLLEPQLYLDELLSAEEPEIAELLKTSPTGRLGEMHQNANVGYLVESIVFTEAKQKAFGIDLGKVGWWGAFKVTDDAVWENVKNGTYPAFSIGGQSDSEQIPDAA